MARGDHIYVWRWGIGYQHHGIDLGGGEVAHFTGRNEGKRSARVQITSLGEFCEGSLPEVVYYGPGSCHPPDVVVAAARSFARLGRENYHLAFNNCEHFATFCKSGQHESFQVLNTGGRVLAASLAAGHPLVALAFALGYIVYKNIRSTE